MLSEQNQPEGLFFHIQLAHSKAAICGAMRFSLSFEQEQAPLAIGQADQYGGEASQEE
jgi:hypothetical protein